jgi:hypothetical protein
MDNMRGEVSSKLDYCEGCYNMNVGLKYVSSFKHGKSMKNCPKVSREISSFQTSFRRSSQPMTVYNVTILLTLFILHAVQGFNLDIKNKIEFSGPNPGSYYGYTVAMHKQETGLQESW